MSRMLGVMGGTFNPIHLGHLILAEETLEAFRLDEVIFIPNKIPPHRQGEKDLLEGKTRLLMTELASASNPRFRVSPIEINKEDVSYTIDTIKELKSVYPQDNFCFIAGIDSLIKDKWYKLESLLEMLNRFIAAVRPGYSQEEFTARIDQLNLSHQKKIKLLEIPRLEISSTIIRERLKENRSIKYMVPEPVESYIHKYHLYK